jgi:hypothetical protein
MREHEVSEEKVNGPRPSLSDWHALTAIDWWERAIQLMHHTGEPLDCQFNFANARVSVRVELAAVRDHEPVQRH